MPQSIGQAIQAGLIAAGVSASTAAAVGAFATAYIAVTSTLIIGTATASAVPDPSTGAQTIKQPSPPRRGAYGRCRIAGSGYLLWTAKGNEAGQVLPLCDGPIDGFEQMYLFDQRVEFAPGPIVGAIEGLPDGSYPYPFVKIYTRQGLFTETAYVQLVTLFPGEWTNSHRGDGIATLAMTAGHGKQADFQGRYPSGEPQPSVVVRAALVFDPRDDLQIKDDNPLSPSTWQWSDNPVLALLHYEMVHERRCFTDAKDESGKAILVWDQAGWDRYFAPTIDMWKAAADICDETVPLAAGGSVKRYTLGGFYEENNPPDTVRQTIRSTFDGWTSNNGQGALTVFAGKLYTPTVTLSDADILDYSCQRYVSEERAVNQVLASFTDPEIDYATSQCLPWRDEADIAVTGKEKNAPLPLPWVQNNSQARRLAKRFLAASNPEAQGMIRCDMTDAAFSALGERYVRLQCSDSATIADRVVELSRGEIDLMDMTISFDWVAVDDTVDDWNAAVEENTNLVSERTPGEAPEAPAIDSIEVFFDEAGGARLRVTVSGYDRGDETWGVRYREAGSEAFVDVAAVDIDPSTPVVLETGLVAAGSLEVIAGYWTGSGTPVWMDEADAVSVSTLAGPDAPTEVAAEIVGSDVEVGWRNPASANLHHLKVRRGATNVFSASVDISSDLAPTGLLAVQTYTDTAPLVGAAYYWVVAYTEAGEVSEPGGPASV